jgi:glycosyltransferase involved in cell wall biosynthesis
MSLSHASTPLARSQSLVAIRRRAMQLASICRSGGLREVRQRFVRRAYNVTGAVELEFPLLFPDITDSQSVQWAVPSRDPERGRPLTVGWAMTPPGPGSGGHTTNFRMVQALEQAGHRCVIHLYDRHQSLVGFHAAVIREHWPWMNARMVDARMGLEPADAYVATCWESAHVIGKHGSAPGRRLYFVQDYEPYFYPYGSEYALAEDTYRFGFRTIALGGMVAERLRAIHQIPVDRISFGTDLSVYRLTNRGPRNGVVFYAKPRVARRGYALAMAALQQFHERHPDQEIHLFGDPHIRPSFPAQVHGTVSPGKLAELYNTSIAGIAISFTNISLVPYEMLACGTIPVVNDDPFARAELTNPAVRWAQATPSALADELSAAVICTDIAGAAKRAANQVEELDWERAKGQFVKVVENETFRDEPTGGAI